MSLSLRTRTVRRLLESKAYRDAYVIEHIKNGIAFQIRTLREDRDWTQGKLGEIAEKPRNVISRLEDPNYGKFTLATLIEIASAFDVGLMVKFVPFSRLTKEYDDVSPEALSARSTSDKKEAQALTEWAAEESVHDVLPSENKVAVLSEWVSRAASPGSAASAVDRLPAVTSAGGQIGPQRPSLFFDKPRSKKKARSRKTEVKLVSTAVTATAGHFS